MIAVGCIFYGRGTFGNFRRIFRRFSGHLNLGPVKVEKSYRVKAQKNKYKNCIIVYLIVMLIFGV